MDAVATEVVATVPLAAVAPVDELEYLGRYISFVDCREGSSVPLTV